MADPFKALGQEIARALRLDALLDWLAPKATTLVCFVEGHNWRRKEFDQCARCRRKLMDRVANLRQPGQPSPQGTSEAPKGETS